MRKLLILLLLATPVWSDTFRGTDNSTTETSMDNPMPVIGLPYPGKNLEVIVLQGNNADIDIGTEDVWTVGGTLTYLTVAETMDMVGSDVKDDGTADAILTLSANALDGDTVTIGTTVYTFQDTLTNVDGNVHIGAAATDTIDNLIGHITLTSGVAGTDFALAATAHADVTAVVGAGDTMLATTLAFNRGTPASTDDNAQMSWGTATLDMGVGVRRIIVSGVDDNYTAISEVIRLNGTAVVVTTLTYLRVNRIVSLEVGSELDNAGTITATATSAATIQNRIAAGDGISHSLHYTVPNGKIAYVVSIRMGGTRTGGAASILTFAGKVRELGHSWLKIFTEVIDTEVESVVFQGSDFSTRIQSKLDLVITATTDKDNTIVNGRVVLLQVAQ